MLDHKQEEALKAMWNKWPLRMGPWLDSLGSTLFSERGTATWTPLWKKLRKRKGAFCVWGSTGQNARMYICRCSDCGAIETAGYGKHEDEDEKQGACNKLAKFVLGRNAEDGLQG